jgi:hypothetical protein
VTYLRCETCGLVYSRAAVAREMVLAMGVDCRRCGGTLTVAEADEPRLPHRPVVAVRSAVTGEERLPFG